MFRDSQSRAFLLLFPLAFSLIFVGCSSQKKKDGPPVNGSGPAHARIEKPGYGSSGGTGEIQPPWDPEDQDIELEPPGRIAPDADGTAPLSQVDVTHEYNVVDRIHFDYDSDVLKSEWIQPLENNARWMMDHQTYFMIVEGHCDERGTSEYNLALGERRAKAIRVFLVQRGVEADRVQIRSYGEEQPLDAGHDETAWYQNRRAEFQVGKPQ